jgi:hypothetical protein
MAEIKRCNCNHAVQDKLYGTGMRVMNATQKKDFRCTVCGATHK